MNNFDDYQHLTKRTARPLDESFDDEKDNLILALGLTGEAGEVADYIKKIYGHDHPADKEKIAKELGDVLYYTARLAEKFGYNLSDIAQMNIDKLAKRYPDGFSVNASLNRKE